jgi:hypothetical protein
MTDDPAPRSIHASVLRRVEQELCAAMPEPAAHFVVQPAARLLVYSRQHAAYFAAKGGTKSRGRPRPARAQYLALRRSFMAYARFLGIDARVAARMLGPVEPRKRL